MELGTDKMLFEQEDYIGWITFNNPAKRNAVSREMWEALATIVTNLQEDKTVRVVILKGAGDKAFVSGADIAGFKDRREAEAAKKETERSSTDARKLLERLDRPVIAMIQGYCLGGGLAVALNADVRFATGNSIFGIPAARLGLGYGFAGVKALVDLVGPSSTKDILFSGRFLNAEEALRIGLINQIVPTGELESTVREYARVIANNAPLTIRAAKACVREVLQDPAKREMEKIEAMIKECFDSEDFAEGQRAFMEKRPPVFKGR